AQCADGLDNDGDGLIDYPNDPGCSSASDNDEYNAPGGGGGGGGGGGIPTPTTVNLSGQAYPLSNVTVLKDGQIAVVTIAGPDANFNISLSNLSEGNYIFSVFSEDNYGRRSSLFSFSVYVTSGATTQISGIFLSPTIAVNRNEIKKGEDIAIFGQSIPDGIITIAVNSEEEYFVTTPADESGVYLYNFDTTPLAYGQHLTKSKARRENEVSNYGRVVTFKVGTETKGTGIGILKGDLNDDGRVNLIDFSIAAFWYKRILSETFSLKEAERLSNDGKVDLVDFSIMAYYWTG
ncbi:hypothetical protein KKF32_02575, partial [Patescibacteria group bacterium]|nr:hypothetical protein [Patescibacteria group bacterium]